MKYYCTGCGSTNLIGESVVYWSQFHQVWKVDLETLNSVRCNDCNSKKISTDEVEEDAYNYDED